MSAMFLATRSRSFRDWAERNPDGVLITDLEQNVVFVNPAYERFSGYSSREWLGKKPRLAASGQTPAEIYRELWEGIDTRGTWSGPLINRRKTGAEWISFVTITVIRDRARLPLGYLCVSRDITGYYRTAGFAETSFSRDRLAESLMDAAERHEPGIRRHLERVRGATRDLTRIAKALGHPELQEDRLREEIVHASVLHDVGKVAIPRSLLAKPSRLSRLEFSLIQTHTHAGYRLLSLPLSLNARPSAGSGFLGTAAEIAISHHERWDGSGYPGGLAGCEIPIGARVVAVVDVYDSLRSRRAYKRAWSHADAAEYITSQAGRQFDPSLVQAFSSYLPTLERTWPDTGKSHQQVA